MRVRIQIKNLTKVFIIGKKKERKKIKNKMPRREAALSLEVRRNPRLNIAQERIEMGNPVNDVTNKLSTSAEKIQNIQIN